MDLSDYRQHYDNPRLGEQLPREPWPLLFEWMKKAVNDERLKEPNAMALATATPSGKPSVRIVLLKEVRKDGIVFYTNYNSRKGEDIARNPEVAATIWWPELERQVRVEGKAEKVSEADSDAYFQSRPLGSRIGALVSPQSSEIPGPDYLVGKMKKLESEFKGSDQIERPDHWGGYIIRAERIEFWQGQRNRLHDRILFQKAGNSWDHAWLAP